MILESPVNREEYLALAISTQALRVGRPAVEFGSSINARVNMGRNRKPGPCVSCAIREEKNVGRRTWCMKKRIFCQNSVELLHKNFESKESYLIQAY